MTDKRTVFMTGATSGFGTVVARHLIKENYKLVFTARSEEKAKSLKNVFSAEHKNAEIDYLICDLSSFESVKKTCTAAKAKLSRIDILLLNAGMWNFEYEETIDGIEETFQVNLLSNALLFLELQQLIPKNKKSKVIFTASGLHQGTINYQDIEFRNKFSGFKAYRQSKLGIILLTRLLAQLPVYEGISFYAVHPGVVKTKLGQKANWISRTIFKLMGMSIEKGALTHLQIIDAPNDHLVSGEYYAKRKVTKTTKEANDLHQAKKLMKVIREYIAPHLSSDK